VGHGNRVRRAVQGEVEPRLGAADEPFMDITVRVDSKKTQVRILTTEKLAESVHAKIAKLVK
jgi:hypothetical protein